MTRKRVIKKMMVMGFNKRALTNMTRAILADRDRRRHEGQKCWVTWDYIYASAVEAWICGKVNVALCNERWKK